MSKQHEIILTIDHPARLHLRPATLFVTTATRFQSAIRMTNLDREEQPEGDAKSLFGVMQQAVSQGHGLRLRAEEPGADEALPSLQQLVHGHSEAEA